jgi:hypothetical protein
MELINTGIIRVAEHLVVRRPPPIVFSSAAAVSRRFTAGKFASLTDPSTQLIETARAPQ